jgi:hypothetical protein
LKLPIAARGRIPAHEQGQALLIVLLILGIAVGVLIYNVVTPARLALERDKTTAVALAQAKLALLGFAAAVDLSGARRPGDLPCPDTDDDGDAESSCGNAAGSSQSTRLGRLPWKTLGLPDLRDGYGERLWYAVSNNFKNNTRTTCAAPGDVGCLNSDTRGTITIVNSAGTILHDGRTTSGIIAVVFAPGPVLVRQDGTAQIRGCTVGADCTAAGVCSSAATPKCNAVNYLDVLTGVEDNAAFVDDNTDGFVVGDIRDASNTVVVNDRLLAISRQDMMPLLEKRVAKEVLNCLTGYANENGGRYPWAAPMSDVTPPYGDLVNNRFGRLPDAPMSQTVLGIIPATFPLVGPLLQAACGLTPALCMSSNWPTSAASPACHFANSWWTNWKEQVFYDVSPAYSPRINFSLVFLLVTLTGITPPTGCPTCITVSPPSATADKRVAVIVAGRTLPGQVRTAAADKISEGNYLEDQNNSPGDDIFTKQTSSATFNDVVQYIQ